MQRHVFKYDFPSVIRILSQWHLSIHLSDHCIGLLQQSRLGDLRSLISHACLRHQHKNHTSLVVSSFSQTDMHLVAQQVSSFSQTDVYLVAQQHLGERLSASEFSSTIICGLDADFMSKFVSHLCDVRCSSFLHLATDKLWSLYSSQQNGIS